MKEKLTKLAIVALLSLGLGLSGCRTTGHQKMMDNSLSNQKQTAEKNPMHPGTMTGTMETSMDKKMDKKMDNSMAVPPDNMEKGDMQSDMSGSMK